MAQLKGQLLQAVSRSNNPRPGDNLLQLEEAVEAAAAQLAAVNPTPDAAASPLLLGAWALLFSGRSRQLKAALPPAAAAAAGSQQSLRQAVQASSDALYSTFYKFLPVLAGSAVGAGRRSTASNLQVLLPGRVDNVVSTRGRLPLRICVSGTVEEVPPDAGAPASCVAVTFDCFTARLGGLPEARLSLAWLSPLGFVDTLYLDEDTRVSVGDKGGLFVLRRVAGEAAGAAAAAGGEAQW